MARANDSVQVKNPEFLTRLARQKKIDLSNVISLSRGTRSKILNALKKPEVWINTSTVQVLAEEFSISYEQMRDGLSGSLRQAIEPKRITDPTDPDFELFVELYLSTLPQIDRWSADYIAQWIQSQPNLFLLTAKVDTVVAFSLFEYYPASKYVFIDYVGRKKQTGSEGAIWIREIFIEASKLLIDKSLKGIVYEVSKSEERWEAKNELFRSYAVAWGAKLSNGYTRAFQLLPDYKAPKPTDSPNLGSEIPGVLWYIPIAKPGVEPTEEEVGDVLNAAYFQWYGSAFSKNTPDYSKYMNYLHQIVERDVPLNLRQRMLSDKVQSRRQGYR